MRLRKKREAEEEEKNGRERRKLLKIVKDGGTSPLYKESREECRESGGKDVIPGGIDRGTQQNAVCRGAGGVLWC